MGWFECHSEQFPVKENDKNAGSLLSAKRGVTVYASPFNTIKLELGIILLLGVIAWILVDMLVANPVSQLLYLGGFGLASMSWIVLRIKILKRKLVERGQDGLGKG